MGNIYADEMVSIVRAALGGVSDSVFSDNFLLRLLNFAYLEVATSDIFPELRTSTTVNTASGTDTYELPTTMLSVIDVTDQTDGYTMEMKSRSEMNVLRQGDDTQAGQPYFWTISGSGSSGGPNMEVYPVPDGVYKLEVWYKAAPTDLVLSPAATTTVLGPAFDETIINKAIKRGHAYLRRFNEAAATESLDGKQAGDAARQWRRSSDGVFTNKSQVGAEIEEK